MNIEIDSRRLSAELEKLATFSATPAPSVTRVVFTAPDMQAREWLKARCAEAGLEVREDPIGNTFARWQGSQPEAGAVGTGSHIDAIPNAGKYDGTVGVLGALEAMRGLRAAGWKPRRSLELLLFTSEEPTRFGIGCLGSRMLSGALRPDTAQALKAGDGTSLEDVRSAAGFRGPLVDIRLPEGYYDSFIELHIEQGPLLEASRTPIGIVTNIAAPASLKIKIDGEGGHAGAVLMPHRHDAFLGAAEIALAVEAAALGTGSNNTVATTGVCNVFPGAVNSIPSTVSLEVDARDVDLKRRDSVLAAVQTAADSIAGKRGLRIEAQIVNADDPATCDARLVDTIAESCQALALHSLRLVSRAYHDSLFMARIAPTAMIFIPCRGGVSHRPDEYAAPEDIANGCRVLAQTLARLAA